MKNKVFLSAVLFFVCGYAYGDKPCIKPVPVDSKITRIEIPSTPFLGTNLILPFKLDDSKAIYTLSSDQVWTYVKSGGTNVVPLTIKAFKNEWGKRTDFTIIQDEFIFSITMVASRTGHCTNYLFEFTEEFETSLENEKSEKQTAIFDRMYSEKLNHLDEDINNRVLDVIGKVVNGKKISDGIHEESSIKINKNESFVVYVKKVVRHGIFSVLFIELENHTRSGRQVTINDVAVSFTGDDASVIRGKVEFNEKMAGRSKQSITFSTLSELPKHGATITVITNIGEVEVSW